MKRHPNACLVEASPINAPVHPEEPSLVAALGAGDLAALAAVFDRWHQRVRVLARRLLSDPAAAEDVVQDVFTALPRAVRRFRGMRMRVAAAEGEALQRVRSISSPPRQS